MQTRVVYGKVVAEKLKAELRPELDLMASRGIVPQLMVVLVGDDPASRVYVRNKTRTCQELGMKGQTLELPASTTTSELLDIVHRLNDSEDVDGVLVQLPLPDHIDETRVLEAVDPRKDVDGLHPVNVGRLLQGDFSLVSCTPMGIMEMLKHEQIEIKGREAVVVGRSNIVGKPMAVLLLHAHATVTICHSRTRNLAEVCRRADILVTAIGRPGMITREFIKPGAAVIDVGTNRVDDRGKVIELFGPDTDRLALLDRQGYTLVGDVHPRDPYGVASVITPVPGGVGPLTIAQLMRNTVIACRERRVEGMAAIAPANS